MKSFDLIVIGWGKGGKTLAALAAGRGEKVAVVERDINMYGGTCINVGCIPSKSLVAAAARRPWPPESSFEEKARYYRNSVAEKRQLTAMLRDKMYHQLADEPTVEIFNGTGCFVAPRTLEITHDSEVRRIKGRRIVIDTGAAPILPDWNGLRGNPRVFTSREMLDCETLPPRLIIVGGGFIGLEFASIYAGFGSRVTLLQRGRTFLPREDQDIAAEIARSLTARGVNIVCGVTPQDIRNSPTAATLTGIDENGQSATWEAEAILIATGRRPDTEALHLERGGIVRSPHGGIAVDDLLRTTAPDVWALGDVVGSLQFTYVSLDDSRIIAPQLWGDPQNYSVKQRVHVPNSVFLDPPYSRVGLNEREAREQQRDIQIVKLPAAAIPKAQVLKQTTGLLKAVIDTESQRILGTMLFCAESHELINTVKLAMDLDLPCTSLADRIYTHPTMSEALNNLFHVNWRTSK